MMRALRIATLVSLVLLFSLILSFFIQRHLGLLSPDENLEHLIMRVAAWPLIILIAGMTAFFGVQSVRADVRNQKQLTEQQQIDAKTQREQQTRAAEKAHREFAVTLVGAQLTTGLFDRTKPVAYYLNPMLEQLKPYGKKPKGVFAPANGASYIYEKEPTIERKFVLYLQQLSDKLIWPFRFPALTGQFLYKDIAKLPINQFLTLPKEFDIKEPERVAAVEKGFDDPAIPENLPEKEKAPLDPPAWRWIWRYVGLLKAYLRYPTQEPFNEFHLQFAHAGGYDSIKNAFEFIEAHPPGKNPHPLVWTLSVDAPQFPKTETDRNANDSGTLLMWSHPQADTGRKPLVFLKRPVTVQAATGKLTSTQVREAIATALQNADIAVDNVGHLVTDFGIGKPGDDYLGEISNALAQLADDNQHGIQLSMNRTDLTASLGDIGANTAGFSSLIAAWAAFSKDQPSLLIGRPGPNRIDVLVFLPRPNHVPPPHDKLYYGAVAEPEFSRPWWGERLDGKPDFGDEPNKERADGGEGLLKPAKPFEFTWE
jgi:hypothetical protein